MSHRAKGRHAEEHAPFCLPNIRNKPGTLPGTFILDQALVI
jgi:hypothetical protein